MLLRCSRCDFEYVAAKPMGDRTFVCSKCLNKKNQATNLGLHPALEAKWAENSPKNSLNTKRLAQRPQNSSEKNESKTVLNGVSNSPSKSLPSIPGFEIVYQVGRGAMGCVYRARHIKSGSSVAIKILSKDLSIRSDLVARFERESYALKSLDHENIVSIIDSGKIEDTHYFAMEYIDGMTLRTRINRGSIPVESAIEITKKIISGLSKAHEHGIIHRDLKPENVLLSYKDSNLKNLPDRVVLVDFGLVGIGGFAFDPHPNLTRSKVTMGTVNYMAPEQHLDAKRVDYRSDLYSAGVILYEMITGDLPLGRYLMPSERGVNEAKHLDNVLSRALARDLDERFSSAFDFLQALRKAEDFKELEKSSNEIEMPKTIDRLKKFMIKNIYQSRFVLLAVAASLFFGFGIKLSFAKDVSKPSVEKVESTK